MGSSCYESIVIGGGVMGSATAYYLSRKYGEKVLLLEQFDCLHKRGSSHGESRIIRMTYAQDYYTYLMPDAFKLWNEIEAEAKTKLLTKTGGLDFGRETNSDLKLLIAASDKHGVNYQVLSPEELQVKFPTITLPKDQIAVYSPDSGILNATKCVATLQRLAQCQGCDVRDNMSVVQITNELQIGGETLVRVVTANGEEFYGRNCVITTGAWTKKLVKSVEGIELPLQPLQTTVAYWKVENPEAYSSKRFPVFINYEEPLIYGTPAHEYPNMIKCPAHFGPPCDPDTRDFEPGTDAIAEIVSKFLQETFVGVDTKPSHTESCIYTHSPDNDFIIDRLPSNPNLFVGCGFSGHGFKLAPVVGRILSELVISKAHPYPEVEKHFSLDRFKN